jgi:hypothetical protein
MNKNIFQILTYDISDWIYLKYDKNMLENISIRFYLHGYDQHKWIIIIKIGMIVSLVLILQ